MPLAGKNRSSWLHRSSRWKRSSTARWCIIYCSHIYSMIICYVKVLPRDATYMDIYILHCSKKLQHWDNLSITSITLFFFPKMMHIKFSPRIISPSPVTLNIGAKFRASLSAGRGVKYIWGMKINAIFNYPVTCLRKNDITVSCYWTRAANNTL